MRRVLIFAVAVCVAHAAFALEDDPIVTCAASQIAKDVFEGTALGQCWEAAIKKNEKRAPSWEREFNVLVFNERGEAIYSSPAPLVAGNRIYVGVIAPPSYKWALPTFDPCGLESASPNVFATSSLPPRAVQISAVPNAFTRFPPQRCYDTDITVKMHGTKPGENGKIKSELKLKQYQRYRASLQLGALYTDRRDHTFTLRPGAGDTKLVTDSGPTGKAPEYLASLVFFGLPHYLSRIEKKHLSFPNYPGRDLVHERSLSDRLGLMVGMGVSDPKRRITAGLAFEVLNGLNVTYSYELARVKVLNGVKVNDPFSGAASDIPLRDVGVRGWAWGFTFDPRYATELFTGK